MICKKLLLLLMIWTRFFLNDCDYIKDLDKESLYLSKNYYDNTEHMRLLFGRFLGDSDKVYPVGFIIC